MIFAIPAFILLVLATLVHTSIYLFRMIYCQLYKYRSLVGIFGALFLIQPNIELRIFGALLMGFGWQSILGGLILIIVSGVMLILKNPLGWLLLAFGISSYGCIALNALFILSGGIDGNRLAKEHPQEFLEKVLEDISQ